MKVKYLLLCAILITSCNSTNSPFKKVECNNVDSTAKISKYVKIYEPCKEFIFQAKYWDREYNLISDQRIWMMATGKKWGDDEKQAEIVIQYEFDELEIDRISDYNINEKLKNRSWVESETTGFIENESTLWFHPFRANQYNFTELAPLPTVYYFMLEPGAEWPGRLSINGGWGDWSHSQVECNYHVVEVESLEMEIGNISDCYHISSTGISKFGETTFDYWFNKEYGIVKMLILNYENQTLQIELIEVISG